MLAGILQADRAGRSGSVAQPREAAAAGMRVPGDADGRPGRVHDILHAHQEIHVGIVAGQADFREILVR